MKPFQSEELTDVACAHIHPMFLIPEVALYAQSDPYTQTHPLYVPTGSEGSQSWYRPLTAWDRALSQQSDSIHTYMQLQPNGRQYAARDQIWLAMPSPERIGQRGEIEQRGLFGRASATVLLL